MSELISTTKKHLKRLLPNAKDIFIKIDRDHTQYRSRIHIISPGAVIHADKRGENVWEALDLSFHAVLKQIEKRKNKKRSYSNRNIYRLTNLA